MNVSRRYTLRRLTAAALAAGTVPLIGRAESHEDIYAIGRFGNVRIVHQTDTHAQIR